MDGLQSAQKNKEAGLVIIGTTNRVRLFSLSKDSINFGLQPYDLDDAVLRRLPARMMVPLPEENERERKSSWSVFVLNLTSLCY